MASRPSTRAATPRSGSARFPVTRLPTLSTVYKQDSAYWSRESAKHDTAAFHQAAQQVPAYARFLKQHRIRANAIKTVQDLESVPPVQKANYLRAHEWSDLIAGDSLNEQHLVLAATSGSTGKPFYFPRTSVLDEQAALFHRLYLKNSGLSPDKKTLVIVGFGMGVWIGGIITYEAFSRASQTGFPLTVITTSPNKRTIFETLQEIGSRYEQLILCGYPPFIKDVIEEAPEHGIQWKRWDMRILCAAEPFSEDFRSHLAKKASIREPLRGIMNIYGSAELGTMAIETPLSILIRRETVAKKELFAEIFDDARRLPTLAQFIPSCVNFTTKDGSILCTADNALPLIRYEIGDRGGVKTYAEMEAICKRHGIDLPALAKAHGIADCCTELPFVYVYERSDMATKLYGALIFPEHVKAGIGHDTLADDLTGKFTMITRHDHQHNEYLEMHFELKPGREATPALEKNVAERVVAALLEKSDEYRDVTRNVKERALPAIRLWPNAHPEHFQGGAKQKWTKHQ